MLGSRGNGRVGLLGVCARGTKQDLWLGGTLTCYMGHDVILEVPVFRVHVLCYMYALSHIHSVQTGALVAPCSLTTHDIYVRS